MNRYRAALNKKGKQGNIHIETGYCNNECYFCCLESLRATWMTAQFLRTFSVTGFFFNMCSLLCFQLDPRRSTYFIKAIFTPCIEQYRELYFHPSICDVCAWKGCFRWLLTTLIFWYSVASPGTVRTKLFPSSFSYLSALFRLWLWALHRWRSKERKQIQTN